MKARGMGTIYERGGVFWVQYYVHGKRYRETSESTNPADASRLLKKRLGDAASGRRVAPQVDKTTVADVTAMLLADYKANGRRSLHRAEHAVAHLHEFFGPDTRSIAITSDRITAYKVQRQQDAHKGKPVANATINYELAILRRAFRLGALAGKIAVRPEVEMLHLENARKGFFEPEQHRAVVAHLPDYLKPITRVAYITGWRTKSELLTRQWQHVDFDGGWLRLDPGETKNGEGRMFPLTPELRAILETQREKVRNLERATGAIIPWIFVHRNGRRIKNFRHCWGKACKAAGVPGRLVHDLRRTAVRNLERAGVPRSAAMKMTGHRTETVYRRYAIVDEAMLKEGALKLAALHAGERPMASNVVPLQRAE